MVDKPRIEAFNIRVANLPAALAIMNGVWEGLTSRVYQVLVDQTTGMAIVMVEMVGYYPYIQNQWCLYIEDVIKTTTEVKT